MSSNSGNSNVFEPLTITQLVELAKEQPIEYLVEGLLPIGSLNMVAGKPKSGKSTLVRQLASCVAKGTDFLGRTTQKSDVLYFASEEIGAHLAEHFLLMGTSQGIGTVLRRPGVNFVTKLAETLKQNPAIRLVILDPLVNFLPGVDMDDYGQVAPAMANLVEVADKHGVAIVCIHHTKKKVTEEAGDAVLGSSAIIASMCTSMFLTGEMGETRKVRSSQRYGKRMDFTELDFDEKKREFSVGGLVKSKQERRAAAATDAHRSNILAHITEIPISQKDLREAVGGSASAVVKVIQELVDQGAILREGTGLRGSEYTYRAVKEEGSWAA